MGWNPLLPLAPLVLCGALAAQTGAVARDDPIAARVPASALVYLEGPGLAGFLERGLEHPFVARVLDSELGRALLAEAPMSPDELLALGRELLGRDPLALASTLTAGGVALGIEPRAGKPAVTFVARADDDLAWEETLAAVARWAGGAGLPSPETADGADVYRLKPDLLVALRDGEALVASDGALFDEGLALLDGDPDVGLAAHAGSILSRDGWSAAVERRGGDALLWGWLDLDRLRALGDGAGNLRKLTRFDAQPAVHFVLGSGVASLARARSWSAELALDDRAGRLALLALGVAPGAHTTLVPGAGRGERAVLLPARTERELAHAVLYRDLAGLFARRAELFPPDQLPKFAKASADLAGVLGGLDLGEDVLPRLSPWLRFVVREVDFDPRATPDLPLPAACVLVELDDAEATGELLTSGFQTLIAVTNIQRAQQGRPSFVLRVEQLQGVDQILGVGEGQLSYARLLPPGADDGVDVAYNLEPACARVGATFLLGTHRKLVAELARQVARGEQVELAPDHDHLELFSAPIARALRANFAALVAQAVLEEGKPQEQATRELGGLVGLVELFRSASLDLTRPAEGEVALELRMELAPEGGR